MSGIEIAGLVLGAFPLLIYALESYRKGVEASTDWWRIQRAYKKCHQDLSFHRIIFEGNVERFLLPLVVDEDEMRVLMDDAAGEGWEDPELELRLQERLPKSYRLFLDIIGDINEVMESLKKEMGVDDAAFQARVNQDGKLVKPTASRRDLLSIANVEFQAKRIKFTVRKSARERLFTQLQEANDRMRNLLESSDHVTAARRKGPVVRATSVFNRKISEFWRHAKRLHEAMSAAWQCSCSGHITNLGLEHRVSDDLTFDILFHSGAPSPDVRLHGARITMSAVANDRVSTIPPTTRSRQVRFDTGSSPNVDTSADQANLIKDLCGAMSANRQDCIGFLEADDHRFMLYPASRTAAIKNPSTISLSQVLRDAQALTRRRRYLLALTLASSYLQLGATPWLDTHLEKEDIVFLQDPDSQQTTILDYPYIRQGSSKSVSHQAADAITSLGIRLLELCFGTSLETTEFRKQLPAGDDTLAPIFDFTAAIQWSRLVSEEAGPEFSEAIEWCLNSKGKDLNNGSWRKDLWQHVVVPLDACHKQVAQRLTTY